MTDVHIIRGASPLIVSFPHVGTDVPDAIAARMTPQALRLDDTDFEQPALYDFTDELEASTVTARWSRLVIDVNRPPDNKPLYPGQWGAGLVPTETFLGEPVYRGAAPDAAEIAARRDRFWRPYHDALRAAIDAAVEAHGFALLWDAHSISAVVPKLFEGTLPDLNMGTAMSETLRKPKRHCILANETPRLAQPNVRRKHQNKQRHGRGRREQESDSNSNLKSSASASEQN